MVCLCFPTQLEMANKPVDEHIQRIEKLLVKACTTKVWERRHSSVNVLSVCVSMCRLVIRSCHVASMAAPLPPPIPNWKPTQNRSKPTH